MDVFGVLGAGLRFDKKRFHNDMKVFSSKPSETDSYVPEDLDFFKKSKAKVTGGENNPENVDSFQELSSKYEFPEFLLKNLEEHFSSPTPIQAHAVPVVLEGKDLLACAPTGSGKTLSFIIPILHQLKSHQKGGFRAVVVSPTRELAQQIYREFVKVCENSGIKICCLTKNQATADNASKKLGNYDVLVTTPMRLVHALKESIRLDSVKHLVLDEADRLLELGFVEQVDEIIASCTNPSLQKCLYSATIPSSVEELASGFMKNPTRIVIGSKNAAALDIKQKLLFVGQEEGKIIAIRQLIQAGIKPPVLIFVQSIERAKELFHELVYDNINVDVIHSERTQAQRDAIVHNFRLGKIWVLIATELMARGLDFKGVNLVINYDFPQTVASYIHRIGRTGRAGRQGEAVTYYTKDDVPYLKSIVNVMRESGCEVPDWMLTLKKPSKALKKDLKKKPIERKEIKTIPKYDQVKMKRKQAMVEASKKKKARQQEEQ